jgi:site-specific recombinase XerD
MQKQASEDLLLGNSVSVTSLESLVKGYLINCQIEGKTPKTIAGYEHLLHNFVWYLRRSEMPEVQELNRVHLRQFFWYLSSETHRWNSANPAAQRQASATTVNDYFRAIHTFFNWLEREELIPENPFRYLKAPKVDHKVIRALIPKDLEKLFRMCSGKSTLEVRNKAILSLFLDTGLRVAELTNLLVDDVNMDDGSILVRHGKGNKQRVVRIGLRAQKALWRYINIYRKSDSNRLFINLNGEPLKLIGVKIMIKRLGNKAGVKVHPHQLRHTFAISFLRTGGDVFSLRYLLGH